MTWNGKLCYWMETNRSHGLGSHVFVLLFIIPKRLQGFKVSCIMHARRDSLHCVWHCPGNNKNEYATTIILLMKGEKDCFIIMSRMLKFIGGERGAARRGILVRVRGNNRVNFAQSQSGLLLFGGNFFFSRTRSLQPVPPGQ